MLQTKHIIQTPLGAIAIHANDDAINAVLFVKKDEVADEKESKHLLIKKCISQLNEYFSGTRKIFDLPLQQDGFYITNTFWQFHIADGFSIVNF